MVVTSFAPPPARPLFVVDDPELLDELLRISAAAGVEVEVAHDPGAARARFLAAPLVLVGVELAESCVRARLERRAGLVLVGGPAGGWAAGPVAGDRAFELAQALRAEHLALLPAAEAWLARRFADVAAPQAHGKVVAVLGGRGGAGASILSAGLAVTAARQGRRVLLVDADPLGGGVDLVLGWEALDGVRWPTLVTDPVTATLVETLPSRGDLAVLSWDRGEVLTVPTDAMATALQIGRARRDLIVVDLPRRFEAAAVLALAAADRALLLVPAELRACAAAARVATLAAAHTASLELIVRVPAPGGLTPSEIAEALGLPLAGSLRGEPQLARGVERGDAPAGAGKGPLAVLGRRLLTELDHDQRAVSA